MITTSPKAEVSARRTAHIGLGQRLALEVGPLLVFFIANEFAGIYAGTAAFMVATLAAATVTILRERRLPFLPVFNTGLLFLFGAMTFAFADPVFIKIRPTILNGVYLVGLLAGLASGRIVLKMVMRESLPLSDEAWRRLTIRLALFLLFLTVFNEVAWRNLSTDAWVAVKTFAVLPLYGLFGLMQVRLVRQGALPPAN